MKPRTPRPCRDILSDAESQFEGWRRSRRRGARIPAALWQAAVDAAREHGVSKVASALSLDYYRLKERLESVPVLSEVESAGGGFLEVPLFTSSASECIFELEDGEGTRLRVELKGAASAELETLARTFWSLAR